MVFIWSQKGSWWNLEGKKENYVTDLFETVEVLPYTNCYKSLPWAMKVTQKEPNLYRLALKERENQRRSFQRHYGWRKIMKKSAIKGESSLEDILTNLNYYFTHIYIKQSFALHCRLDFRLSNKLPTPNDSYP